MSFDVIWLLVLCHVTWCNAMSCDVRSCDELSSVVPYNGMNIMSLRYHWLWGHVVWFELVLWRCGGDPKNFLGIQSTTLYYNVPLQYFKVLQRTTPASSTTLYYNVLLTPVLLCTTKYYSSTTLYYNVLLQYYSVLQRTTPALQSMTTYHSSTTLYYKVLLQYHSALQSTTPVLLCTTKYYSSTTLYYKVLLQYDSVLQSTTPVLLCTTKYYSSTTLYYNVLLQCYSVLQSPTPVLLCTTKYYSSSVLYCKVLLQYYSNYKVLLQYYSVLQSTTPVLLCTAKYYSSTTLYYKVRLQYYSVLHCATKYYSSMLPLDLAVPGTPANPQPLHCASARIYQRRLFRSHGRSNTAAATPTWPPLRNLRDRKLLHTAWKSSQMQRKRLTAAPMALTVVSFKLTSSYARKGGKDRPMGSWKSSGADEKNHGRIKATDASFETMRP